MPCSIRYLLRFCGKVQLSISMLKMEAACFFKHISNCLYDYSTISQETVTFIISKLKVKCVINL
jgi:hypothetical protein